ncbi:fimbrial protein [Acinetobacter guillouiae]|uniref:fimbrial protein n=1 Tax=Acinetobacter guillouiae TaxID=106649 RepID=UPI003AF8B8E4
MKKLTLATLSTLALTLSCANVFAVDGTITVNGVITDGTCTLLGNSIGVSGTKDITVNIPAVPKSWFISNRFPMFELIHLSLKNATGTGPCDAATVKALKGIHLGVTSPTYLDATDKRFLVNRSTSASTKNPVFISVSAYVGDDSKSVDFSEPWGDQVISNLYRFGNEVSIRYVASVYSKTGIVDAQNVTATINYTLHYN